VRRGSIWNGPAAELGCEGAGGVAAGGGEQATKSAQMAALGAMMAFMVFGSGIDTAG
jgi:hypothetical protein